MKEKDFQQLSIVQTEYDRVWCYCCFHKDTIRPNLSISLLDKYYGRYKCWACSAEGYLNSKQMDALNLLNSIIPHKNDKHNLQTRWKQFAETCYDNLQKFPLLKLGLARELNVSVKSLDKWLVGYDGNSFTIPMFREDLAEYNKQRGFCGIQRRFPDGTKRCITGSRLGLMYPYQYIGDYYMFICEGFSDAISVWDLGLQSVARPHCRHTEGVTELFSDILDSVETIVIVPDNDTVGMEGAYQLQDELEELYYYDDGNEWETDCDISIFSFNGAKDIREYITLKGKDCVRRELNRCI